MPWPAKQAIAILVKANRQGKSGLAKKARDSLRRNPDKKRKTK